MRLAIPLLGLGALLSFLTEPVKAWLSRYLTPLLEPIVHWLARVVEPLGSLLSAIGPVFGSLFDFLFGWLPDLHLPFEIPDWVWTTAKIALFALIAFSVSRADLRRRQKVLEEVRAGASEENQRP